MYRNGHGTYNETAGSFYNVNPVFNPEDNGRASPQFPTQHVPVYNPALTVEHMHSQARASREYMESGGIVNYSTRAMHAENYSLLQSQASAKTYGNIFSGLGRATSIGSVIGGLALGTNPLGLALMGGAYFGEKMFNRYNRYYEDFSARMGNIASLRSMYSGAGNIVNPATGVMSGLDASRMAAGFDTASYGTSFSEQDMYSIHSLANRSGLMAGHKGSINSITDRVTSLAKLTKQIMDMGQGIDQHQATEMLALSRDMEIDLDKFKSLDISRKIISAAKLTNKSIQATNAMIQSAASASQQAGLGGQMGAESALYMSRFAAPQFGYLSAKQQAAVGGSQDAYVQNLVGAQVNFASRNATALALGSYYVDPSTGKLRVDTGEVAAMAHRGLDPVAEQKRGMRILDSTNKEMLRNAGISQNFVTSVLQENIGTLGKTAINFLDSDTRTAMAISEINRTAADNGMTFNQAAASLGYSTQQTQAMVAFGQNFGKGGQRSAEADRLAYLEELRAREAGLEFVSNSQYRNLAERRAEQNIANRDASVAAIRADRSRREAIGIYGRGSSRNYSDAEISAALTGGYDVLDSDNVFNFLRSGASGRSRFGVYSGRREKDVSRGYLADTLGYSGHESSIFGKRKVSERAMGTEVLQKLYATDFYGDGTDIGNENIFGVDMGIMSQLAFGNTVLDDVFGGIRSGKAAERDAKDTMARALREIYGGRANYSEQMENVKDPEIRAAIAAGVSDGFSNEKRHSVSMAVAALQVREVAAFAPIGRSLRSNASREGLLNRGIKTDDDGRRINAASKALNTIIDSAASTNSNIAPTDASGKHVLQSRRRMANAIFKSTGGADGPYSSVEDVEADLPQIMAASMQDSNNARKALTKLISISETASSMRGAPRSITDAGAVVTTAGATYKTIAETSSSGGVMTTGSVSRQTTVYKTVLDEESIDMTISEIVLGKTFKDDQMEEAADLVSAQATDLASATEALSRINPELKEPGAAQRFVSDMIYGFTKFVAENETIRDMDKALKAFLRQNSRFSKALRYLGKKHPQHRSTIVNFMKQSAGTENLRKSILRGKSGLQQDEYADIFKSITVHGKDKLQNEAVQGFLRGSSATDVLFGKDSLENQAGKARKLFTRLNEGFFRDLDRKTSSGATDIDSILEAMFGEDLADMSDDEMEDLREIAAKSFKGGNLSAAAQKNFAIQLQKQIQAGKMKSVGGVGGKGSNFALIQSAIEDMRILQSATAKLLTALATGGEEGKVQLSKVADLLQSLQSPSKRK